VAFDLVIARLQERENKNVGEDQQQGQQRKVRPVHAAVQGQDHQQGGIPGEALDAPILSAFARPAVKFGT
jgi:hypothetical protein